MLRLYIDTETTGLLKFNAPVNKQPKVINFGAVLEQDGSIIEQCDLYIKIDSFIPKNIIKLTGITDEFLQQNGSSFRAHAITILHLLNKADEIVGHNLKFDLEVLSNDFSRHSMYLNYSKAVYNTNKKFICTVDEFTPLFGYAPKLEEVYKRFIDSEYQEKHTALQDALDLREIYLKLKEGK